MPPDYEAALNIFYFCHIFFIVDYIYTSDPIIFMEPFLFSGYSSKQGSFGLREIKYGRARLSLLRAFIESIGIRPFEEIRIKDLCSEAEVSEPSFYNYFPKKDDLFLYFISLWSVDVQMHIRCMNPSIDPGVRAIREIFRYTAAGISQTPRLMKEIIAYQARTDTSLRMNELRPVTNAEKALVFGETDELYSLPDQGLRPLLSENIAAAVDRGDISSDVGIPELTLLTASVFFGIPVIILHEDPENLNEYYQTSLDILFNSNSKRRN